MVVQARQDRSLNLVKVLLLQAGLAAGLHLQQLFSQCPVVSLEGARLPAQRFVFLPMG